MSERSGVGRRADLGAAGGTRDLESSILDEDEDFRFELEDDEPELFDELDLLLLLLDFDDLLFEERRGAFLSSSTSLVQWTIFLLSGDCAGESG